MVEPRKAGHGSLVFYVEFLIIEIAVIFVLYFPINPISTSLAFSSWLSGWSSLP